MSTPRLRNVAIVAHVDHGKTTLVDALFRQAGTVRANQRLEERAMDSDDQERERGITILAKNTAVEVRGTRINIVDTPGHADFGGQVERTLIMADAVLLLVDSHEGPMPQTRFVLRKAFEHGLRALVMINKLDRPDARPQGVLDEIFDLFVELGADDDQLEFPVIYGSGRDGWASLDPDVRTHDLEQLFDLLLEAIPAPPCELEGPLQLQIATLEHDDFVGRLGVGRVQRGTVRRGERVLCCHPDRDKPEAFTIKKLFRSEGLERVEVESVSAGDIAILSGSDELSLGDTICDAEHPEPLPPIHVDEPTVSMVFQINDSPFAGQEGTYVTSRQVRGRLERAALRDPALEIAETGSTDAFEVKGRGVMHLSVLVENLRREGYEFAVGKPHVLIKEVDGKPCEPVERATVEVPGEFAGKIIEYLGRRRGELAHMESLGATSKVEFYIPARGLIGARTALLTLSQGEAILSHVFDSWRPDGGPIPRRTSGVLVADRTGPVVQYALGNLQDRGRFFVEAGDEVYEGMIVGENGRDEDLPLNVCRARKHSNVRSSTKDIAVQVAPARTLSLEESLEFLEDDELLEVTPQSLRLRKRIRNADQRRKANKT